MVGPSWNKYLSLNQISLRHERPITFVLSQWQIDQNTVNVKYCIFRTCMFITFFVSWVFSIVNEKTYDGSTKWPIYLTNWGFTICMIQALLACIMLTVCCVTRKKQWQDSVLKIYPVYWLLNVVATPVAFTITVIYWSLIYNAEHASLDAMNFLVHGVNSLLMLLDLLVVAHPVKIFHFLYPLALSLIYAIFTYVYFISGGLSKDGTRYIYPIIKWDKPGTTTLVCLGVMVFLIVLHLFTFGMFKLRIRTYEFIFTRRRPSSSPKSPSLGLKAYENSALTTETV